MKKITSFNLKEGEIINGKYEIISLLGKGWEGEVYLVREIETNIERAAKFFFPHRNLKGKTSSAYAKKLHKLRNCDIIIHYYAQETYFTNDSQVTVLISEFIEGELLGDFLKTLPGKKLHPFAALHLLHSLAEGIDQVHRMKEYHGDLHTDNVMLQRFGLHFDLKVIDLYRWGSPNSQHIRDDVVELVRIFYEILGGKKAYPKLPQPMKDICCGLKRSLILKKFNTAGKLKGYIENLDWD
jgi:serine/threonine protein kinase